MPKLPLAAAALLALVATTSGCVVDMVAMADLPSGTVYSGRSSSSTTVYTGRGAGAVIIDDEDDYRYESRHEDTTVVVVPPARRAPVVVPVQTAPARTSGSSEARNPVIQAFTANPSNFVPAGQPITFQVVAHDPQDQPMQFNWSATGGTLSTTTGQMVVWNPPAKAGVYTVSTIVTNARGGAVTGSQNLIVEAGGEVTTTTTTATATATTTTTATTVGAAQ